MTPDTVTPAPGRPAPVSLRAAARHLGVSVESIRRAIKAERITRALRVDSRGRQCLDLATVEQEWHANLTDHQLRGRPERAPQAPAVADKLALAVPVERFSVFADAPLVVLAVIDAADAPGADPDVDRTTLLPMSPETARQLAAALLRSARSPGT